MKYTNHTKVLSRHCVTNILLTIHNIKLHVIINVRTSDYYHLILVVLNAKVLERENSRKVYLPLLFGHSASEYIAHIISPAPRIMIYGSGT